MANDAKYPADAPLVWPATVTRSAARQGGPWTRASIEAVVPRPLHPGEKVTVLPLRRALPRRELPVAVVDEQPGTPPFPSTWALVVDATVAPFLSARPDPGHEGHHPFDAIVVSPPAPKARLLARGAAGHDLPAAPATLWAAVDLTGDGKPDAAIFRFCCEQPSRPARAPGGSPCQTECVAIYLRDAGQSWRLVHQASDD
jgi:hypothetical protein